jgi:hypothetical protein
VFEGGIDIFATMLGLKIDTGAQWHVTSGSGENIAKSKNGRSSRISAYGTTLSWGLGHNI